MMANSKSSENGIVYSKKNSIETSNKLAEQQSHTTMNKRETGPSDINIGHDTVAHHHPYLYDSLGQPATASDSSPMTLKHVEQVNVKFRDTEYSTLDQNEGGVGAS